ncbi:MAG TPA: DUF58 domain-containing protein [Candidatus Binatia bacterium]|jgi:uncharacterized protein (DUF58 family)|nr:DUF58 domain-containing protein [Candidatus Binatia bacterium]
MLGSKTVGSAYANPLKTGASSASIPSRMAQWTQSATVEVWAKFLLALVGLGLAFAAALFSTISRDAGNLWATVLLASASLLLATFVGLVTVPYLARRVAVERMRQSFDYDVTRAGIVYVLVTVVIAIAAVNTGNNLLYIVVAAMLGAILVSGSVSAWILRALELDIRLPEHVFAGRPVAGRIVVHNPRRWLPSFSVRVISTRKKRKKPSRQWQWEATEFAFPFNRPKEEQWLRLPDRRLRRVMVVPPPPGIFQGMAYFPFLPPRAEACADLQLRFDRRGRYREDSFGIATRFPFAFFTKTRHVALPREVLVYPRIEPTEEMFEILPLVRGEWESFVRGRGSDLYRIREYLPEDSARHVDWKATAKSGSLKVREFAREDERKLCIVFDNPEAGVVSEESYEKAVDLAASLAWHFSTHEAGVSYLLPGRPRTRDLHEFLGWLAVVQPANEAGREASPHDPWREMNASPTDEYHIAVTARARGTVPTSLWDSSYFVFVKDPAPKRGYLGMTPP